MSEVTRFDLVTKGRGFDTWQKMEADPDGEWVKAEDYDALRAEVERLRADIRDARGLLRGMIDAKDGRVARFLIERAERFIERTAVPTDGSR